MERLKKFLQGKRIHIVGVTGSEGSGILRLLRRLKLESVTVHDFVEKKYIEKSYRLWHKGITGEEKKRLFKQFRNDLSGCDLCFGRDYLGSISKAEIIFVPQSWRLYQKYNSKLWQAKKLNIPFYSLTRLYLDFSQAKIIGITGTVGKGSTANLLFHILKKAGKKVVFAGNETWMIQAAGRLDKLNPDTILLLEISHRQLMDGLSKAPQTVIFTNIFPNHLDEVSWLNYKKLKFTLLEAQTCRDTAILNYDNKDLRDEVEYIKSKVIYFSEKNINMNIKSIHKIYNNIMNIKYDHYNQNILAASTAASILEINQDEILKILPKIPILPARLELIKEIKKVQYYDDLKSTTPWATLAGINKLNRDGLKEKIIILICGGRTKGIDYQDFARRVSDFTRYIICLEGELDNKLKNLSNRNKYRSVRNLSRAITLAQKIAKEGDKVLISPAAGFFYTDFIKGQKSIKKIVEELN